jgi:hypothetical protein
MCRQQTLVRKQHDFLLLRIKKLYFVALVPHQRAAAMRAAFPRTTVYKNAAHVVSSQNVAAGPGALGAWHVLH